jgi:hypothetical protein
MSKGLNILINTSGTYEQLETFKDENITIKENVKDFRDIKKVLTSLSKSFTIPASKRNNRILGHYYRNDLFNVDSRALIDAKLTLNDADYKFGNVSLEDTKFKNNEPYSYTIRFYGNLTELNKKIGEDELTDLDFSAYDLQSPSFFNQFQSSSVSALNRPLVFPLLSRDRRFLSHSGDSTYSQTNGYTDAPNVSYVNSTRISGYYGVVEQDLVGALQSGAILDAIEAKYGLNFTGVFNDAGYIRDLRLLLLKRGGDGLDGGTLITKSVVNFTPSNTYTRFETNSGGFETFQIYEYVNFFTEYYGEVNFQVTTTASNFKVHLKRNGETIETVEDTNSHTITLDNSNDNNSVFTFETEASGIATITINATVYAKKRAKSTITTQSTQAISGSASYTGSDGDSYVVSDNLPQMKVIDFISDLIKRFNIVATVDSDLNVDTQHFDYYINQGNTIDISKYVDISGHKIGRPNFHSGIRFTTEKVETIGEYGFQKVNGRKYGELKFDLNTGDGKLDGEMYKVDLKSKMIPIDQPVDVNWGIITNFQSMILVDKKGEETQLAPTFLYTKIMDNRYIAYDNGSSVVQVNSFIQIPSEVYYENEDFDTVSLGEFVVGNYFASEPSVILAPTLNFKGANLFNAFYSKTISIAFGEASRRAEYTAYLPIRFLSTLSTADIIVVANKKHIIESYSTNFLTGKTSFNLIQIDEATYDLFTTQNVTVVDTPYSKESSYMSADTGRATRLSTNNTTTHNVIGGDSGVYRMSLV